MNQKTMFIINCALTCITVLALGITCGGCTTEQLEHAQSAVAAAQPAIVAASPAMATQPWYIFVLLAADIASSGLAAAIAFKKKTENQ